LRKGERRSEKKKQYIVRKDDKDCRRTKVTEAQITPFVGEGRGAQMSANNEKGRLGNRKPFGKTAIHQGEWVLREFSSRGGFQDTVHDKVPEWDCVCAKRETATRSHPRLVV